MATRYWVGGTGDWGTVSTTNWSASSGGTNGASVPTLADTVVFDNNSNIGTNAFTVSINGGPPGCLDFTFGVGAAALDGVMTLTGTGTLNVAGSMTLVSTNLILSYTGTLTFNSTAGIKTITTANNAFDCPIIFNGVGGTWQLIDNLTTASTRTVTLTNGTLNLDSKVLSCGFFSSTNTNTRTLAFGTGNVTVTGSGTTIWTTSDVTGLTITGTPLVRCTYSGATGTRTLAPGNAAILQQNAISFNITAGTDTVVFGGSSRINDLNFTGFSGTFTATNTYYIHGSLTLSSGMTWTGSAAVDLWFVAASGTKTITSSGKTISNPIYFQSNVGVGANDPNVRWQLGDAFITNQDVILLRGNFDAVSYNFTCLKWSADNLEARGINMGSGTWTITGSGVSAFTVGPTKFNNGNNALTLNSNNSTISFTNNDGAYLNGNNQIFNNLNINPGSSILRLNGNSTFNIIKNVDPRPTLAITGGAATTVITVGFLTLSGNTSRQFQLQVAGGGAGNMIGKSPGTTHSLSFCNVTSMNVSVGIFYASNTYGNKDLGTNTGWKFDAFDPVVSTGFLNF